MKLTFSVWSKLESGGAPQPVTLVNLVREKLKPKLHISKHNMARGLYIKCKIFCKGSFKDIRAQSLKIYSF